MEVEHKVLLVEYKANLWQREKATFQTIHTHFQKYIPKKSRSVNLS